jgi:hypothetical protein
LTYERVSDALSHAWFCLFIFIAAMTSTSIARAQQFVLLDQTYTATTANTSDSHYKATPSKETPSNWTSPVAYAPNGTLYAHFEVQSKPSAVKTDYNICLDGSGSTCMGTSPLYTSTGTYDFSNVINTLWNYSGYDFTKPATDVALIMKDADGTKQQGSADFYPTTIHVVLTVVAPGSTYVPPTKTMDAGMPMMDAGKPRMDAGRPRTDSGSMMADDDAGTPITPMAGRSSQPFDAGTIPHAGSGAAGQAGATSSGVAGSVASNAGSPSHSAAGSGGSVGSTSAPTLNPVRPVKGSSCAVSDGASNGASALLWLGAFGLAAVRFGRRRRRLAR